VFHGRSQRDKSPQGRAVIARRSTRRISEGHLPEIYNAVIEETYKGLHLKITGEVQQHLGGNRVRCVASARPTLYRGLKAIDTAAR